MKSMWTRVVFAALAAAPGAAFGQGCDATWSRFDATAPELQYARGVQWDASSGTPVFLRSDQAVFEWNGSSWVTYSTVTGTSISMKLGCWDPDRQKIVVPCSNGVLLEWNPAAHAFDNRPNSSGIPGYVEGLTYDTRRHRLVMLCALDAPGSIHGLYEESPSGWVAAPGTPAFNRYYVDGFVYDPVFDRVMMLGGDSQIGGNNVPIRLFAYKPHTAPGTGAWSPLPIGSTPSIEGGTTVLDPAHGLTVIGGRDRYRDWRIEGLGTRDQLNYMRNSFLVYNPALGSLEPSQEMFPTSWSPIPADLSPRHGRYSSAIARNPVDGRLIAVGGEINGYTFTPDDDWVFHEQLWNDTLFVTARPGMPEFTLQPSDHTYCTAGPGGAATGQLQALVAFHGSFAPSFQWYRWDEAQETYLPLPGTNQPAFWPPDHTVHAADSGTYRVLAWDSCGMTWSNPATLSVIDPVSLAGSVQWPSDACPGGAVMIVPPNVLGTSPTIVLQKQSVVGGPWADVSFTIPGEPFFLSNLTAADSGLYRVTVSNACNTVSSPEHRIQVGASIESPLTIVGTEAACGSIIIRPLLGAVHGVGTLSYAWFKDGAPLADDAHRTGSNTVALFISPLGFDDSGSYELRVSEDACHSTASVSRRIDLPEPPVAYVLRDPNGPRPAPRSYHAMAYDEARGVVVVYGGIGIGPGNQNLALDDTWEFDGTTWSQRSPVHSPGPLNRHAMVYDSTRHRVVLFGGFHSVCTSCNPRAEIWEWDGADWTQQTTIGGPADALSSNPGLCYDSAAQRVVLYTGDNPSSTLYEGQTWLYDPAAATWTQLSSIGPGTAYGNPALYYDPINNRRIMYVFGEPPPTVYPPSPGVWAWNGSAWIVTDTDLTGAWQYNQQEFPWCSAANGAWAYNPLTRKGESGLMTVLPPSGGGLWNGTYTTIAAAGTTTRLAINNGFGLTNSAQVWDSRRHCMVIFGGLDNYPVLTGQAPLTNAVYERHFADAPRVLDQPLDIITAPGQPASFRVVAVGAPALAYQWRHGGVPLTNGGGISGATAPRLTLAAVTPGDAGTYDCVVTNTCTSTTSDPATLTVGGSGACDPDMNQDGNADQDDVAYLVNVVAGGSNPTGIDPDFNHDGNADQSDVAALVDVVAGGPCP